MVARSQPRGTRRSSLPRNPVVRTGALLGAGFTGLFWAWLWIANRFPEYESLAQIRNVSAGVLLVLLMGIPILRFRRHPAKMFLAGLTAWTLLSIAYTAMQLNFSLLRSRLGTLQLFMLGAICYGFVAVFSWVFLLCVETRQRHLAQPPGPSPASSRAGFRRLPD